MTFLDDRSFSTLSSSRNWNSPTDREPKTAIFRFFNALDIVGCKMRERTCLAKARIWHLSKQTYTKEMVAHGDLYTVTSQRLPVRSPTFLCMPRCNRTTTNQNQFSYLAIKRFFFFFGIPRSVVGSSFSLLAFPASWRVGRKTFRICFVDLHCSGNPGIQEQFSALLPLEDPVKVCC